MRFERLRRQALPCGEAAGWLSDDDRVHGHLLNRSQRSPKLLSGVRDGARCASDLVILAVASMKEPAVMAECF